MNIFQVFRQRFYLKFIFPFIFLAVCSLTFVSGQEKPLRPMTIEDFANLKTIATAAISPDGSQVLYALEEVDRAANKRKRSIWAIPTTGGAARKLADEAVVGSPAPIWSPDGRQFAFFSEKSGNSQVWLGDASGGAVRQLTREKADIQSFAFAPDGKKIAYIFAPSPESSEEKSKIRVVSTEVSATPELHLLNIDTGENKLAMKPELAPGNFSFSPDGKQIAFAANGDISVLNLENGQTRKLVERPGRDFNPQWSPDGKQIAFLSNYGKTVVGGNIYLSIIDAEGKNTPQDNFEGFDFGFGGLAVRFFQWSPDSKSIFVSKLSRMRQNLYRISIPSGGSQPITTGENQVSHDFSISKDGKTFAFLATDPLTPSELFVSSVSDFKPKQLTVNTNPQLKRVALSKPESVRWTSKDGLEIEGLLMKPINYEKGKRYPLLVLMEGTYGTFDLSFSGRVSADTASTYTPFQQQIFAGEGFAVLMPNPRGSWSYGAEFSRLGRTDYGKGPYNDIVSGVDYLIENGIADPSRLGIMGTYFDGYRTAFTITQTDRFKAASVGHVFGFNLVSWYGQTENGLFGGFIEQMLGGAPWQVPNNYAAISPINFAANLKTPTFLFTLTNPDWGVSQSQEFYAALQKNKVPVEYVIYNQDAFQFLTTDYDIWEDCAKRNLNWFNRWLKQK